jgi:hypothetical protein
MITSCAVDLEGTARMLPVTITPTRTPAKGDFERFRNCFCILIQTANGGKGCGRRFAVRKDEP